MSFTVCMQLSSQCIYPCIYTYMRGMRDVFLSLPSPFFLSFNDNPSAAYVNVSYNMILYVCVPLRVFMFKCMYACMFDVYMCESVYVHVFIDTRVRGGRDRWVPGIPPPIWLVGPSGWEGCCIIFFLFFSSSELFSVK